MAVLTEGAALLWRDALAARVPATIPGVVRVTASYLGRTEDGVTSVRQPMAVAVGQLLAGRGPESVRAVFPQQTVAARLTVVGTDLLESVTVGLTPSHGQAPASQAFGPAGGTVDLSVTTQDPAAVTVDWTARVAYQSAGWPVLPAAGRLGAANGWVDLVKPDSWLAAVTVMAVLVDDRGKAVPLGEVRGEHHVQGVFTFTAPYVTTGALVTPFDAANQVPVVSVIPQYPGQPPGELLLNMFATRDGRAGTATRRLGPAERVAIALIQPDARVEVRTSEDAIPESSWLGSTFGVLRA
jgi:hypothetical protein